MRPGVKSGARSGGEARRSRPPLSPESTSAGESRPPLMFLSVAARGVATVASASINRFTLAEATPAQHALIAGTLAPFMKEERVVRMREVLDRRRRGACASSTPSSSPRARARPPAPGVVQMATQQEPASGRTATPRPASQMRAPPYRRRRAAPRTFSGAVARARPPCPRIWPVICRLPRASRDYTSGRSRQLLIERRRPRLRTPESRRPRHR